MSEPELEVDDELARQAEEKAHAEGHDLRALLEQWMREYLAGDR